MEALLFDRCVRWTVHGQCAAGAGGKHSGMAKLTCSDVIPADLMGWCACAASDGRMRQRKLACGHLPSSCADTCARRARPRAAESSAAATPAVVVPAAAPAPALPAAPACSIALVKRQSKCCQCHEHGSDAQRGDPSGGYFGCHSPTSFYTAQRCAGLFRCASGDVVRCGASRGMNNCTCTFSSVPPPPSPPPPPPWLSPSLTASCGELAPPAKTTLADLWVAARAAAGLPPTPAVATRDGLVPEYALSRWLSFCPAANPKNPGKGTKFHPSVAWVGEGGRCLKYHTVYKGANDAIRLTLLEAGSRGGGLKWFGRLPPRVSEPQRCTSTLSFTFVREPLGHFVSGFAEMCYRASPTVPIGRAFARAFVQALLDGHAGVRVPLAGEAACTGADCSYGELRQDFSHPMNHLLPMASILGPLCTLHGIGPAAPQLVGRLEASQQDWEAIMLRSGIPSLRHSVLLANTSCATDDRECRERVATKQHASSADPQGAAASMRGVLADEAPLRRGLCTLLSADYEWLRCLGYRREACLDGSALKWRNRGPSYKTKK